MGEFVDALRPATVHRRVLGQLQMPEGSQVANQIIDSVGKEKNLNESILTVGSSNKSSANLAKSLAIILEKEGFKAVQSVVGSPKDFRIALDQMQLDNEPPKIIVPSQDVQQWRLFQQLKGKYPFLKETKIITPGTYLWPNFLKKSKKDLAAKNLILPLEV